MGVAFSDAFELGRVQRIDVPSPLVLTLPAHPEGQRQRLGEDPAQAHIVLGVADDVAEDPPQIGPHAAQRPVGAVELLGVGVALVGHQRPLAHARMGLTQRNAVLLGEPHQAARAPGS
jgi:hypothetical protein